MKFKNNAQRKAVMAKITLQNAKTIPIYDVERKNVKAGNYWFSPDSMRFFKSRTGDTAYVKGNKAYFVSSEKYEREPRKYSVRVSDLKTGSVNTVGEFQQFSSSSGAKNKILKILNAPVTQKKKTRPLGKIRLARAFKVIR